LSVLSGSPDISVDVKDSYRAADAIRARHQPQDRQRV